MLELVRQHVDRLVEFDVAQSAAGSDVLVHVDYYQLVEDPAAVMPAVFEAIDLEWTAAVEERIRTWRERQPAGQARNAHLHPRGVRPRA